MKSVLFTITFTLFLNFCILAETGYAEHVPGEVLVKYRSDSALSAVDGLHHNIGSVKKREFKNIRVQRLKLPDDMTVEEAIEYYRQDPNVEYAEPNYIVHANSAAQVTPNDLSFSSQWGLHNMGKTVDMSPDADIDAPEAWSLTTGSGNVIIAILDTGVARKHPDLAANIWTNTGEYPDCNDKVDNDGNGFTDDCYGWDFLNNDNDPTDYNGHGTHVAGTIAAVGDNHSGITGVMWQAKIMPVRFMGIHGSGIISDAIDAILYASANGAHIINNSWGGNGYSQALKDAIDASSALVVCAAGNEAKDNDKSPSYPAGFSSANIISVAASDQRDNLAYFSNYGANSVDLAAPGDSIYSLEPTFGYAASETVYDINFDTDSIDDWNTGGINSTWAVSSGTGATGDSLEDSPGGNYLNSTLSVAGYKTMIDSSAKNSLYNLSFKWKGVLETSADFLDIIYSTDGSSWSWADYLTGTTNGSFETYSTDLTLIAERLNEFYFGFRLSTDSTVNYDGVYIDDVKLSRTQMNIIAYDYGYMSGTSMATPHVSGVAGLIKARYPSYTSRQIKDAILNSVEPKDALIGKVATGGRLNAYNALISNLLPILSYSITNSQINLSWQDNSTDESGFEIKKKPAGGDHFDNLATVGANITSYSDNTGVGGYYSVKVTGGKFGDSAYSNVVYVSFTSLSGDGNSGGSSAGGGCFISTVNSDIMNRLLR